MGLEPLVPDGPPPEEVFTDLRWAMDGFWRLSNTRPIGFAGPQRIPLSEIDAYCRLRGLDFGMTQDFLFYVERLDEAYMAFVKEAQEKEAAKKAGTSPPKK
ncbi:hypothetical protein KIKIMORA_03480 [Brevundimonas phage vB_BpoS-Kikimora]|uniref:Tail assembly chaperone n=1 Tax=Brevundimonas phage vB_BpoS-Kikimora TaxID=2948601 RepID=A0A9E7SL08_9CAUD|nr:hypothetical protein KIKIMORA_03480 [Brevundimonas phage vB_BpoS-Kikimora]